jgi:putative transposase
MPRRPRVAAADALHRIMVRSIEMGTVFRSDTDRDYFLDRLGEILQETNTICYASALIPNHFHLPLRIGVVPISTIMSCENRDPILQFLRVPFDVIGQ